MSWLYSELGKLENFCILHLILCTLQVIQYIVAVNWAVFQAYLPPLTTTGNQEKIVLPLDDFNLHRAGVKLYHYILNKF